MDISLLWENWTHNIYKDWVRTLKNLSVRRSKRLRYLKDKITLKSNPSMKELRNFNWLKVLLKNYLNLTKNWSLRFYNLHKIMKSREKKLKLSNKKMMIRSMTIIKGQSVTAPQLPNRTVLLSEAILLLEVWTSLMQSLSELFTKED